MKSVRVITDYLRQVKGCHFACSASFVAMILLFNVFAKNSLSQVSIEENRLIFTEILRHTFSWNHTIQIEHWISQNRFHVKNLLGYFFFNFSHCARKKEGQSVILCSSHRIGTLGWWVFFFTSFAHLLMYYSFSYL